MVLRSPPRTPQTDIGYSPKITLPYAAYAKAGTAAIATTNATAQIGVRICRPACRLAHTVPWTTGLM